MKIIQIKSYSKYTLMPKHEECIFEREKYSLEETIS